jgi:hypothetical protein
MMALAVAITLAIWLPIATVLGVEKILALHHATVIGKAAALTGVGWCFVCAALFIWLGPLAEWRDGGEG